MTLQIIGAGFGRTGTASLQVALGMLGFPAYHMKEVFDRSHGLDHLGFWTKVANAPAGEQHDWPMILEPHYTATTDFPACSVWRELHQAYPDAKVVLSLHPKGAAGWYDSAIETIWFTDGTWQFRVMGLVVPFMRKFRHMTHVVIWERALKGTMPDRAKAVARYEAHADEVKAAIPPEQLLVYSVDQGWGPLCAFLGVPVPDAPFPRTNDRAEFLGRIKGLKTAVHAGLAVAAVLVGVLIWLIARAVS